MSILIDPDADVTIREPGVYDMPHATYLADPVAGRSLSSSGARDLLPPSCPAIFRWRRDNPRTSNDDFDFGHAAHTLVLGSGPEIVVVDADDWRTKAAREERDQARARGAAAILRDDHWRAREMFSALSAHHVAPLLFSGGRAEQTLIWQDQASGVWRRARPDYLPAQTGGRPLVVDYKTTNSAAPEKIAKSVYEYGYHQQAAWYLDGAVALGHVDDPAFLFVFQEKTPPYLVTVVELDAMALRIGRELNRRAIDLYAECAATDTWPGYSTEIEYISLPRWAETRHLEDYT